MSPSAPSAPAPARGVATFALVAGMFVVAGVLHTSVRVAFVDEAYALSRVEAEHRALAAENAQLKVEWATLRSPARIEPLAHKLGLVRPSPHQIVSVSAQSAQLRRAVSERELRFRRARP